MHNSYRALIIEPSMDIRTRLKEAMKAVAQFGEIVSVKSLDEAVGTLKEGPRIDVIFISSSFDKLEAQYLIDYGKSSEKGREGAYILLMSLGNQESSDISSNLMSGADGFLVAPFSVDALTEITEIANKVKLKKAEERCSKAMEFLVQEMMDQVDQLAKLKKAGHQAGISSKVFKEMAGVLKTLDEDSQAQYFSHALENFPKAQIPSGVVPGSRSYSGKSERVRKRLATKTLSKVHKLLAA